MGSILSPKNSLVGGLTLYTLNIIVFDDWVFQKKINRSDILE